MESSRLPRKALADIHGEPLLIRLVERVAEAIPKERIVLCTSAEAQDDAIADLASARELNCFRGDGLDVIARFTAAAAAYGAGTIARVTGDNPLTDPLMLREMFERHLCCRAEYTFTNDLPAGTRAEIIDVEALNRIHGQLTAPSFSEYMTYMLKRPDKMRQLEVPAPSDAVKRPEISVTVDTPHDLALVRDIYAHFGGTLPPLAAIVRWLDTVPERVIKVRPESPNPPENIISSYRGDTVSQ